MRAVARAAPTAAQRALLLLLTGVIALCGGLGVYHLAALGGAATPAVSTLLTNASAAASGHTLAVDVTVTACHAERRAHDRERPPAPHRPRTGARWHHANGQGWSHGLAPSRRSGSPAAARCLSLPSFGPAVSARDAALLGTEPRAGPTTTV